MFSLGDVAKLIGTSKEAIRFFEKKGYLKLKTKNDDGSYEFDVYESGVLRWFKMYRSYGFSMKEAADLVSIEDPCKADELLTQREKELENQIAFYQKTLTDLKQLHEEMVSGEEKLEEFIETYNPPMLRISLEYSGQTFFKHIPQKELEQWYNHMPLVKSMPVWHMKDILELKYVLDTGLGIDERDVIDWDPKGKPFVEYYHPRRCLSVLLETPPFGLETWDMFHKELQKRNYVLDGDIYSRPIALYQKNQEIHYYHRFYIPYK